MPLDLRRTAHSPSYINKLKGKMQPDNICRSVLSSLSVMRPPENWMPLVFQPISCLKRLPTSVPCQRTPLSHSLTFIWHTDNRKIARPSPLLHSPIRYSTLLLLNPAIVGTHPVSHAIVICLFWSGEGHTHRQIWVGTHVLTHTHTHKSFSVGI